MTEEKEIDQEITSEIQMPEGPVNHRSEKEVFPDAMVDLINQWIPSAEEMMSGITDEKKRKDFEDRLTSIKEDFSKIKDGDWKNDEAKKQLKEVYDKMENVIGEVGMDIEDGKKS
ncbi:MAG: hypothetical protein WC878_01745 [Candidatus Paceibacterota bacterium]|jgi:hypothetical protein